MKFPLIVRALRVRQQIGDYYVCVIKARLLLEVAYSDKLKAYLREDGCSYELKGTQRELQERRLKAIAKYIDRNDSAFPNSIILAANFREEDGLIECDPNDSENPTSDPGKNDRWQILEDESESMSILIPSNRKLAAIIDGQHRLFSYTKAQQDRLDDDLICSVFFDIPKLGSSGSSLKRSFR